MRGLREGELNEIFQVWMEERERERGGEVSQLMRTKDTNIDVEKAKKYVR